MLNVLYVIGIDTPNPFDQMKSAAMMGPNIPVRPAPATSAKYVTSGVSHYVGVYNAVEVKLYPEVIKTCGRLVR